MRRAAAVLTILFSVAALSAQSKPNARGRADHTGDEAALQKLNAALVEAISAGDFKKAGALWDEDGTYYSVEGEKITGPAQIGAALSEALNGAKVSLQNTSVHWASTDIAVVQGSWQVSGSDGQGNSGLVMSVIRRAGTDWKFVEVRPWVPAQ
jgi:ketosteroid isomerase-like protein